MDVPALHDHHTHVSLYGALADCPNLQSLGVTEAWELLRGMPKDRLSLVLGWHSGRLPLTEEDLTGLPPLVIMNLSLHGLRMTPNATEQLRDTEEELVERHTDPLWCERNLDKLMAFVGSMARLTEEKLDALMTNLARLGVYSAEDMLLTGESAYRLIQTSRYSERIRCWTSPSILRSMDTETQTGIVGVKLFLDGALGARTAALAEPFLDGSPGLLCYTDEGLRAELESIHLTGKAVAIHAIGEQAIEQAISSLERLEREGLHFPFVRLEHVQLITEHQAKRAKHLGLTLSMQPNFSSDSRDYADRLSERQCMANNPFRMLIDCCGFSAGEDLIFGSDGMPHGLESALQWSLFPVYEGQTLSLEECFKGYAVPDHVLSAGRIHVDNGKRIVRFEGRH